MGIEQVKFVYSIFLTIAALSAVSGRTPLKPAEAKAVVENYWHVDRDGRYIMRYETTAGVVHYETGYLRRTPSGHSYPVKEGYYMYPTADGKKVRVSYFADHEGFRVTAYEIRNIEDEQIVAEINNDRELNYIND